MRQNGRLEGGGENGEATHDESAYCSPGQSASIVEAPSFSLAQADMSSAIAFLSTEIGEDKESRSMIMMLVCGGEGCRSRQGTASHNRVSNRDAIYAGRG